MSSKDVGTLRTRLSWEGDANQGIATYKRGLSGLRSEMKAAQAQGREYTSSLKGLREQKDILTRRLQVNNKEVSELRKRYEEAKKEKGEDAKVTQDLATQYNNAVAEMKKTEQQLKGVTNALRDQEDPWKRLAKNAEEAGERMQNAGRKISDFGRSYSMRVTAPILGAGAAALKVGMDFEEGMSKVQALTQGSASEMKSLTEQAKDLGATTRFSATQAADAMSFLGMAGWKTQEIMAGMPGLLSLAASSNMDLGRAADITSNIMSAFSIKADKAGHVADVLAASASNANTSVEQMGLAMTYVAPVANTLGWTIEETAASVMAMSDAGLQGEKAGSAFATSLQRLAKPTTEAQKVMDRLKLSFFDANGVIKPLPQLIGEIEHATKDMTGEQKAAALTTIVGAEAFKNWSVMLEAGSGTLEENTQMLIQSEGAAKRMADTMQANAKGAITEFKSSLEGAGIALSEHMIPTVTELIKKGTELVRKFGELDSETQKQIVQWGLLIAAVGPASMMFGGMITTVGGILKGVSLLATAISGAGGLTAAFAGLLNPVTLGIGAVAALGFTIYQYTKSSEEAIQINLDTAQSLNEQHKELTEASNGYHNLRVKANLTSKEFGKLLDIRKEMQSIDDAEQLAILQSKYDELRKKSGLTNEELDRMIGLNDIIIEKAPHVAEAHSKGGEAIAGVNKELQDYLDLLEGALIEELELERMKWAAQRQQNLMNIRDAELEIEEIGIRINKLKEYQNLSQDEILEKLQEASSRLDNYNLTQEEILELNEDILFLEDLRDLKVAGLIEKLQEQRGEQNKIIDQAQTEIDKGIELENLYSERYLRTLKINESGQVGIKIAEEQLAKLKEQKSELEKQIAKKGDIGGLSKEHLDDLNKQITQHETVLKKLNDETGLKSESVQKTRDLEAQTRYVTDVLTDQNNQINRNNSRIDEGTGKAKEMSKELGKDISKKVKVDDGGTTAKVQQEAEKGATKKVTLSAVWSGVASGLTAALSHIKIPGFAEGTDYHHGGPFIAGEEGFELGRLGNRWEMLDFGMYSRPAGYQVFTHDESKDILSALDKMPAYATGASRPGDAQRVMNQLNSQDGQSLGAVTGLLQELIGAVREGKVIEVDGKVLGRVAEPHVTERQNRNKRARERFA
ncbi:phage tail tape measure protein [Sutcliffiella horikoshii]|uniref:phage tail tape measure protein n=1 Tax=Sutcliffiella horikoshii TaxID=79883 RepID=UPI00203C5C2B|nr:phage tail tape measure protein [Sutcliffiella horikoshii]MCM3619159.1 phage tail tape measure protein [Sutcliffiella horikoshii]